MLMTSGANFGVRRTLPHLSGVAYGFPVMLVLVGLGAMRAFDAWPPSYAILRVASVSYMLWLAWKITQSSPIDGQRNAALPLRFWQAAAFQWVNPKAWTMALGAVTLFAANRDFGSILWIAAVYAVIGTCSALTWTVLGSGVRRVLADPARLRLFNWSMAALLLTSTAFVLIG